VIAGRKLIDPPKFEQALMVIGKRLASAGAGRRG
jgi:hypothetical protein